VNLYRYKEEQSSYDYFIKLNNNLYIVLYKKKVSYLPYASYASSELLHPEIEFADSLL